MARRTSRDDCGYNGLPQNPELHAPHFVYVICYLDGPQVVKVGFARDPLARLRSLQGGNHLEVRLFAKFRCDDVWAARDLEKAFHRAFAEHFVRGEWFKAPPQAARKWLARHRIIGCAPREKSDAK